MSCVVFVSDPFHFLIQEKSELGLSVLVIAFATQAGHQVMAWQVAPDVQRWRIECAPVSMHDQPGC